MTASPVPGYLTDIAYPAFFHPEQAPSFQGAVLGALGRSTPPVARWCEIGCGQGFGATILAAANPGLHFTGIDINPVHIETARTRAAEAGIVNVEFLCADIRDPVEGQFDRIVTHGVLSWVTPEVRLAIAAFIGRHLSPQGVAVVQYMSDPGGAAFRAFHAVFRSVASHPDPVAEGLRLLCAMRDAQAGFFQLHAHAAQTLESVITGNPAYVAHEYLNHDFHPLPFAEVNGLMVAQGLAYLGSATPIENIDAMSVPGEAAKAIAGEQDPVVRETLKDIARNQALRYDLYARPMPPPGDAAHLALLRATRWMLLPGAPKARSGEMIFDTRIGRVESDIRIFGPLFDRLERGTATFAELEAIPPFTGRPGLLNQSLQMALWAKLAHPVADADPGPAARLNRMLLRQASAAAEVPALAAPAFGSGLTVGRNTLSQLASGAGDPALRKLFALD